MGAMVDRPDPDERVQIALVAENSGNQHQRRMAVIDRCLDALLRSALGEEDNLEQAEGWG
jgi:hypothetical protein